MYVSPSQARKLSVVFELLTNEKAQPCGGTALRQKLVEPIADLLNADYVASLVWDGQTERFKNGVCTRGDSSELALYESHYQFSDPIAPKLHPLKFPTRVSQVIAQNTLVKSDFYQEFLDPGAMHWGLNIFAHDGYRDVGDFRIWRARSKNDFDSHEIDMLRLLYPSLVNVLAAASSDSPTTESKHQQQQPAELIETLMHGHGLSLREAQVVQLAVAGEADKVIAKRLSIAYTSVRTYLTNALRKTGLRNRKELMVRFARKTI
jgi:DNA-binding CsgD family transcriptional regulator